ncbi:hypothetical protein F2P81_006305 [Scophthalmus maximus]|uniref:Uncharacterized protein n=1 Tax=Scophthalmus maximus TaxID=52904 RepID=A0A6A4T2T7_SCOMX|nr:hypothetical protein F2P81_006305 [Scophthalmus maximus]
MNSGTSFAANNEGPLPCAKAWLRLRYAFKGKVCQNVSEMATFVLGKLIQLSDRLRVVTLVPYEDREMWRSLLEKITEETGFTYFCAEL